MFGSYFNSFTEMGKRNPGLYDKLVDDERAVAGLI
jgi:N-acetylglucosamine-6-phosphate deacetylase